MATLHLIPTPIADGQLTYIDAEMREAICTIKVWCVEELRTARRFLKAVERSIDIDALTFYVVNEHGNGNVAHIAKHFRQGQNVGLLSEAGCPAVADPGSDVVALAHANDVSIKAYVGPSSLMLALMASGLNGNKFAYHGYLPAKNPDKAAAIRRLCDTVRATQASQIFIEAPYRNDALMEAVLQNAPENLMLCIACDLQLPTVYIKTKTVAQWLAEGLPQLHKRPVVFIVGM